MAGLGLKSIAYMAEKFPERWMEKIPYYRPKDDSEVPRQSQGHSRRHSHSHKSSRKHRRNDYYEEEYPSDYTDEEYERGSSRRHHRSNSLDGLRYNSGGRSSRRPYNPADYVSVDTAGYPVYQSNGYPVAAGTAPAAVPSHTDSSRPSSASGPMPGYVPYAHVYSAPTRSQYPRDSKPKRRESPSVSDDLSPRDSRRSSGDRYAHDYRRMDARGARRNEVRYDHGHRGSREYDSDSDVRRAPRVYDYPDFEA